MFQSLNAGMAKVEKPKVKQLGIKVDVDLWRRFRTLAFQQDRTATELLEEAMREYLERHHGGDII